MWECQKLILAMQWMPARRRLIAISSAHLPICGDGQACQQVCPEDCQGQDCGSLFESVTACQKHYSACFERTCNKLQAWNIKGAGLCNGSLGYYWNGGACEILYGCECEGNDCGLLFDDKASCDQQCPPTMTPDPLCAAETPIAGITCGAACDLLPDDVIDGYYWNGERCMPTYGGGCGGPHDTLEDCKKQYASCTYELCKNTGGKLTTYDSAEGIPWGAHFVDACGYINRSDACPTKNCDFKNRALICNCGVGRIFDAKLGCLDTGIVCDAGPTEFEACAQTGGEVRKISCGPACTSWECDCPTGTEYDSYYGCNHASEALAVAQAPCNPGILECADNLLCCPGGGISLGKTRCLQPDCSMPSAQCPPVP